MPAQNTYDLLATLADDDFFLIVDVSDASHSGSGTTKRVALTTLQGWMGVPNELVDLDTTVTGAQLNAMKAKTDFVSVTSAVDLDAFAAQLAGLDSAVVLRGTWDASAGIFPGGGTAQAGDSYIVSVAGTVDGTEFAVGDRIIAITDNAAIDTFADNWFKSDYTDAVLSVVGQTGAVTAAQIVAAIDSELGGSGWQTGGTAVVSDEAYGATWDETTADAPSKNAVYDKIEALDAAKAEADPTYTALSASRDTVAGDNGADIESDAGSAVTLTVAAGTITRGVSIRQMGAGAVTIAAGAGVTIHKESDVQAVTNGQYAIAFLAPTSNVDTFVLTGSLVAV